MVKTNEAIVLTQTSNTISNKKRRATEIIQNEVCDEYFSDRNYFLLLKVPLSERLSAFESQTSSGLANSDQKQQSLSADSLVTLLTQGLQSSDATLLDVSERKIIIFFSRYNSHLYKTI